MLSQADNYISLFHVQLFKMLTNTELNSVISSDLPQAIHVTHFLTFTHIYVKHLSQLSVPFVHCDGLVLSNLAFKSFIHL